MRSYSVFLVCLALFQLVHSQRNQRPYFINQYNYRNGVPTCDCSTRNQYEPQPSNQPPVTGLQNSKQPLPPQYSQEPLPSRYPQPTAPPQYSQRTPRPQTPQQTPTRPTVPPQMPSYASVEPQTLNSYIPITDFSWSLFKTYEVLNRNGNLILSPILVELLLSQLQKAADGLTKHEITEVIRNVDPQILSQLVNSIKATKYPNEVTLASAIFSASNLGLNASFESKSKSQGVNVLSVDFENPIHAVYIINNWISTATKNQIQNLFKPGSLSGVRVLLANTMYFRGVWRTKFNETIPAIFYVTDKLNKKVNFMRKVQKLRASEFVSTNGVGATWVELPYEGNDFSMVVIKPDVRYTLDNLIRQFTSNDLLNIIGQLEDPYKRLVKLKLPKFSIESSSSLTESLKQMGLDKLFSYESNLPYFTNNNELVAVNDVLQHIVLNVDESGTVAAAATSVAVIALSLDSVPKELLFEADQPFLAIIVDKINKVPLFIAKVIDP